MTEHGARPEHPVRPQRFFPRFHWELLSCGVAGHLLVGLDAAELRPEDAIFARVEDGVRWHRCLRCDSWLAVPAPQRPARRHPPEREEISLPLRGRPLRDKIILRLIAVDKGLRFALFTLLTVAVFLIAANETGIRDLYYRLLADFRGTTDLPEHGLLHEIDRLLNLRAGTLQLVGIGLGTYAALQATEAVGLWLTKRWAEYLTFVATSAFIPLEVWELTISQTPLKVAALTLNTAIVAYLLWAKRLFGIRGGAAADEIRSARDVGWQALERTSPEALGARHPSDPGAAPGVLLS
ncbi:MAG: DUF2127 domain-containing protein [Solirubrobacterales bacterium]